jgi:cholesterol oxidase
MNHEFDIAVIGSGFGGSVAAYELAKSGRSVVVLERGRAYPPGSFPRDPDGMSKNFWDPSKGLYGMYDVWSFRHSEAVVCSGLGGGSLIYANVLLRKPPEWFQRVLPNHDIKPWPVSYADLAPHYDVVEAMLGGNPLPTEADHHCVKATEYSNAVKGAGYECQRPPLAVSFRDAQGRFGLSLPILEKQENLHHALRTTCRFCGECDIGCNYGSKNTLDFNYLSEAKRLGAELKTLCEVRSIAPSLKGTEIQGYEIEYEQHSPDRTSRSQAQPRSLIRARRVILAAGTLGSTYLLLRNRDKLPRLSSMLGCGYSTNGDLLAFAIECTKTSSGTKSPRSIHAPSGPVITSAARVNFPNGLGGYVQDAGYPQFVSWLVEAYDIPRIWPRVLRFAINRWKAWWTGDPRSEIDAEVSRLIGSGVRSRSSLPLLGMGCDRANGKMRLRERPNGATPMLDIDWSQTESRQCFEQLNRACEKITKQLGGNYLANPLTKYLHRLITVHPLGGCTMGENPEEGVVDSHGHVFHYPGLYVADGAILPGPTGANPSLTIAAMARRIALEIVNQSDQGGSNHG